MADVREVLSVLVQDDVRPYDEPGFIERARAKATWNAREEVALCLDGVREKTGPGNEVGSVRQVEVGGPGCRRVLPHQFLDQLLPDPRCRPLNALHVLVGRAGFPASEQERFARALALGEKGRVRDDMVHWVTKAVSK